MKKDSSINKDYDIIIVGSGLTGATIAYIAKEHGQRCLVLERRAHVGGNVYDEVQEGINVHFYGPHIFHTNNKVVWEFVNRFADFNNFRNMPVAHFKGRLYSLPFNMHTFYEIFGAKTPDEARACMEIEHEKENYSSPKNLEEKAISLVGRTVYETLIKGYTEKQWGCKAIELPPSIIERIPIRYTFDNNYFTDTYQGVPIDGYTSLIKKLLSGTEVKLNTDFLHDREYWLNKCKCLYYTGSIDSLYDYELGILEYRSIRFEHTFYEKRNVQGCAVINETDSNIPFTRTIEHKHFTFGTQPNSIITHEYPQNWDKTKDAFYSINNYRNQQLYKQYSKRNEQQNPKIILCGRLGLYKYLNMDEVVFNALNCTFHDIT